MSTFPASNPKVTRAEFEASECMVKARAAAPRICPSGGSTQSWARQAIRTSQKHTLRVPLLEELRVRPRWRGHLRPAVRMKCLLVQDGELKLLVFPIGSQLVFPIGSQEEFAASRKISDIRPS